MMAELCYHIIDLVQNSASADSSRIEIYLEESRQQDRVVIRIKDDGKGMDEEMVKNVQDPFFTTKTTKKVGLGVPLLKETALMCDGSFTIQSQPGAGTTVEAILKYSHIDRPPVGDVESTILTLLVSTADKKGEQNIDVEFSYKTDFGAFNLSTLEIKEQIEDLPINHPEVLTFLRQFISENMHRLKGKIDIDAIV